jgi:hypothetical protein
LPPPPRRANGLLIPPCRPSEFLDPPAPCDRPLTRPATAGESAVAGHPLPSGEGWFTNSPTGVQPKVWDVPTPMWRGKDTPAQQPVPDIADSRFRPPHLRMTRSGGFSAACSGGGRAWGRLGRIHKERCMRHPCDPRPRDRQDQSTVARPRRMVPRSTGGDRQEYQSGAWQA